DRARRLREGDLARSRCRRRAGAGDVRRRDPADRAPDPGAEGAAQGAHVPGAELRVIEISHDGPQSPQPVELQGSSQLPDALPVLPLREMVAFPHTVMPLAIGQERSVKLVNDVLGGDRLLVMVASKDPS